MAMAHAWDLILGFLGMLNIVIGLSNRVLCWFIIEQTPKHKLLHITNMFEARQ